MKLLFESSCCFLLSAMLVANVAASYPAQWSSEDVYARAEVNLSDPAKQYIFTKDVFVLRGKTIKLFPIDEGAPPPDAVWRKNGQLLAYYKRKLDGKGREYAYIGNAEFGDNGVYTYEAADGKSDETYAINLEVLSSPYFTFQPRDVDAVEHRTVEIRCEVNGAPKPAVKWMRDDEELSDDRYETMDNGSLRMRDVLISDSGEYTCYATNEYGAEKASARLKVNRCTKITEFAENSEMLAGERATFRCNAVADPTLRLRIGWQRNGQSIDVYAEPRIIQHADKSLMIVKANSLDSGTYTCVASTDLDEARAQATLVVFGEPSPPTLLGVTCGSDEAQVSWAPADDDDWWPILRYSVQYNTSFTPDTWETATHRVPATDQTYAVKLSPWANYTFRVITWNEHGASEPSPTSSVCTTLPDVPYRNPENVEAKGADDSTNLVIKWTVMPQIEHHAPNFMYRVYYKRDIPGEKWTVVDIRDWRTNQLTINSNQTGYQEYKIKVIAVNEKGESTEHPKEIFVYSGEDAPLQAPGNVTFEKMTSGKSFLLSWTKVPDALVRGELRGYRITFWNVKENYPTNVMTTGANETQVLVDWLPLNSIHHATIKACNRRFEGPPSEKIIIET